MIRLLARLLIKDHKDYSAPRVRGAYGMLSGCVGIALNLLLFTAKFFAGLFAKAISLQADAFNNLGDAGSSLIALFGFRLASKKPDRDHPYGHGRFEYIAGLFVSVAILLMGFSLFRSPIVLKDKLDAESVKPSAGSLDDLVGKTGTAVTPLRPSGIALIDGQRYSVMSQAVFIEKDAPITVLSVDGTKITVA